LHYESTLRTRQFSSGPIDAVRSWVSRNAGAVVVLGPSARAAAIASGAAPDRVVESVNSIDLATFGDRPRDLRAAGAHAAAGPHRFAYVGQGVGFPERAGVRAGLDRTRLAGAGQPLGVGEDRRIGGPVQPAMRCPPTWRLACPLSQIQAQMASWTRLPALVRQVRVPSGGQCMDVVGHPDKLFSGLFVAQSSGDLARGVPRPRSGVRISVFRPDVGVCWACGPDPAPQACGHASGLRRPVPFPRWRMISRLTRLSSRPIRQATTTLAGLALGGPSGDLVSVCGAEHPSAAGPEKIYFCSLHLTPRRHALETIMPWSIA